MEQKYFSVNEIIKHFKKKNHSLNFEDICGYVRKRIIHPVVYIDSVPTHAHEPGKAVKLEEWGKSIVIRQTISPVLLVFFWFFSLIK